MALIGVRRALIKPKVAVVAGPQAAAFLARTSGLDARHTSLYITLINGLVADLVWSQLDLLYILATQNSTVALLNLTSSSFPLSAINAPTFAADQGYTGNGSNSALDTGWIASSNGVNFVQNSASVGFYCTNNRTAGSVATIAGAFGTVSTWVQALSNVNLAQIQFNDGATDNASGIPNATQGSWAYTRDSSAGGSTYRNGSTSSVSTYTSTSTGLPTASMYLLAGNSSNSPFRSSADTLAAAYFGSGLSGANFKKVSDRLNAFMAGLATPVNVY